MKYFLILGLFFCSSLYSEELDNRNMFAIDLDQNTLGSILKFSDSKFQNGNSATKENRIGIGMTYARRKTKHVQFNFSLDANRFDTKVGGGSSVVTWTYAVGLGPIFNFGFGENNIRESWFLGALIGLQIDGVKTSSTSRETNHLWYSAQVGKRFSLESIFGKGKVMYSPSVSYKKIDYDTNASLKTSQEIAVNFLRLDWFYD